MGDIGSWGGGEVETVESVELGVSFKNDISMWARDRILENLSLHAMHPWVACELALLGSVRSIAMSPAPEFGYDPIPLIRSGEKTHTLRGNARVLGTVNQVSVGGTRIPLWLRWVARQRVTFGDVCNDAFASADGFREVGRRSVAEGMARFFGAAIRDDGQPPHPGTQMWVLHFAVFCDLMDELEGRWEL